MADYTIYADLNCPFCYALHSQLYNWGLLEQVDWRLIEHAPDTAVYSQTPENQAELASEVFVVRSRAPEVDIALPPKRSDSRFATLCVIQAEELSRQKAIELRHQLYRALWVEGRDIADVSVIYDCLTQSELPQEVTIEEQHETLLNDWQENWEQGGFNLRIPALSSSDGRKTLGLPPPGDLKAFFRGAEIHSPEQGRESCPRRERQALAIFVDGQLEQIWPLISLLRDEYDILLPATREELQNLIDNDPPALLMLHADQSQSEMLQLCETYSQKENDYPLPVIFLAKSIDEQMEIAAYNAGASDVLYLSRAAAILQARIKLALGVKKSLDQLARSARIDGLTQVNNRREFERVIETEWRRANRSRANISLIMLDIDHFKLFNDNYGHLAGDGCLRTVAQAIQKCLQRAQDIVCRYGGEEFVVILPETDIQGAMQLAERIRQAVAGLAIQHSNSPTAESITLSLGVAVKRPYEGGSPNELTELADKALYLAKEQGRNCIVAIPEDAD